MTEPTKDDAVIWATSMTGEDFQCVHVDDWRIAQARIAELEAIARSQKAMLDDIAEAAGFTLGDTYSAKALIGRLQNPQ